MATRAPLHPRVRVAVPARSRQKLGEAPRARVVEIQRSRMLDAALSVVDELGYAQATVAHVTSRARVSRRTFYDLFGNREDCLLAALESVVQRIASELDGAQLEELSWRERVRTGLWTILSFFDREPMLARVCVVQALRGGPRVLERREQVLAGLAHALDEDRPERNGSQAYLPLTAQALVGAAFAVVYGRLLSGTREPLRSLYGELMGMIVLPYMGPAVARREQEREAPVVAPGSGAGAGIPVGDGRGHDPLGELPMRITYRTARVLETVAASPGISNRAVGERSGVADQGQISRLLARLERLGLLVNAGGGQPAGASNAWSLTRRGEEVECATRSQPVSRKGIQRRERGMS